MFACSLLCPAEKTEPRRTVPFRCRSRETKSRLKVARNGAGLLANPRQAPVLAQPNVVPAKATCGWFWYFCHQKYRESRDDVAGVLYLFSAKRYPKTPRQMPAPTSSRLTFETGARLKGGFKGRWTAERVISDTTLSLLKPASYAGARAFSRAFVSRLRHRAGIFRRQRRRRRETPVLWVLAQNGIAVSCRRP